MTGERQGQRLPSHPYCGDVTIPSVFYHMFSDSTGISIPDGLPESWYVNKIDGRHTILCFMSSGLVLIPRCTHPIVKWPTNGWKLLLNLVVVSIYCYAHVYKVKILVLSDAVQRCKSNKEQTKLNIHQYSLSREGIRSLFLPIQYAECFRYNTAHKYSNLVCGTCNVEKSSMGENFYNQQLN